MSVGVKSVKINVVSKIEAYLDSRGTTKSWFARQIGATPAQVNNWCKNENGSAVSQPSVGYVLKMLNVLDCKVDDLWELKED